MKLGKLLLLQPIKLTNSSKRDITRAIVEEIQTGILVGCGNPLLDILARVNKDFLDKYELKENNVIMAEEKHKPLYEDIIKNYNVKFIAGGSVQNSLRACQWILQKPKTTAFFGAVGCDENANILKESASKEGVDVRYSYTEDAPTGTCAALITGQCRTLVANLGAAEMFTVNHLNDQTNWSLITCAKYFYLSGFFLVVSLESVLRVAEHAVRNNNCFAFNLSAAFIPQNHISQLNLLMPYVDILFCNDQEAVAFATQMGWNTKDLKEIGKKIQSLDKINKCRSRIVIITQADLPVTLIQEDCDQEFEVPEIPNDKMVDTTGAGDGFVGGFLAQYMLGKPLEECTRCGIYTAQYIIGQSGCTFTEKPSYF